jgi:hypothetical protein
MKVEKERYTIDEIERRIRALNYVHQTKRVPYRLNLEAKIMQLNRIKAELQMTA